MVNDAQAQVEDGSQICSADAGTTTESPGLRGSSESHRYFAAVEPRRMLAHELCSRIAEPLKER